MEKPGSQAGPFREFRNRFLLETQHLERDHQSVER